MKIALGFICLFLPLLAAGQESLSIIERRYNEFVAIDDASFGRPEPERIKELKAAYAGRFADSDKMDQVVDNDIIFLFRAAHRIHFYTHESNYRERMAKYLASMEERHISKPADRLNYYRSLIIDRKFDDAGKYAEKMSVPMQYRVSEKLTFNDAVDGSPAVLELNQDGRTLGFRKVDVKNLLVVVVVTPWCHFARKGIKAIDADSNMASALKGHVLWLMPVEGDLDADAVSTWNSEHPQQSMVYAYKKSGWSMLPEWGTPTFYFFKNGKVVAKYEGWKSDVDGIANLRQYLHEIGLLK